MGDKEDKIKRIEQLLEIMKKNDLVELEIKSDDEKIVLKRAQPQQVSHVIAAPIVASSAGGVAPAAGQPAAAEQPGQGLIEIKAPMVGTFYATPSPDSEPYVEAGAEITTSTVVCIIEAMKVMNEIKSEVEGTIAEVCVKSGEAVEYGQVLFRVKPE
ncbi:MAG: acetyl-CoA carboxylase biotin carboxyl carrier protein [Sedimentisphaerales bacterium]|nr:acetyl-CoA carboxylase biotin carboxyl carrier protein [Sedimentisphaerales bacterium]